MEYAIIDRGRGPEIAGSRITVYDVLAETQVGTPVAQLAREWHLDVAQIELALRYIEEHKEEVLREYQKIKERHARGNPPHIQAMIDATHAKYAPLFAEIRRRAKDDADARASGER
jgi:uncharacterized protein (DUF433 family)